MKIDYDKPQDWFFTFAYYHKHPNGYVRIFGTYDSAREDMRSRYGWKWAFQYEIGKVERIVIRDNLQEVQ